MKRQADSSKKLVVSCFLILLAGCAGGDVFFDPNMDFGSLQTVAVLPFQNLTSTDEAAERVRDTFMGRLLATEAVYVLPPGEVARGISKLPRFSPEGPSTEQVKQLSTILEVDAIFTGVVREYGAVRSGATSANLVSVSLQMLETTNALVVWSASSTKGGIGIRDRLFGGGGEPMNTVTVRAVDDLLDKLFD
jgi:TolB-like protein